MNWLTKEEIKAEAGKGEMEALRCSLKHHQQGRDATSLELQNALEDLEFSTGGHYCACCLWSGGTFFFDCKKCPLTGKGADSNKCCGGAWKACSTALQAFDKDPSNANHIAFIEAESKVCEYIQGVIDEKEKKPELRHGGVYKINGHHHIALKSNGGVVQDFITASLDVDGGAQYLGDKYESQLAKDGGELVFNLCDDLNALQQPLEEFEVKCRTYLDKIKFWPYKDGSGVRIQLRERSALLDPEGFDDLILNLRRMQVTLKQKGKTK